MIFPPIKTATVAARDCEAVSLVAPTFNSAGRGVITGCKKELRRMNSGSDWTLNIMRYNKDYRKPWSSDDDSGDEKFHTNTSKPPTIGPSGLFLPPINYIAAAAEASKWKTGRPRPSRSPPPSRLRPGHPANRLLLPTDLPHQPLGSVRAGGGSSNVATAKSDSNVPAYTSPLTPTKADSDRDRISVNSNVTVNGMSRFSSYDCDSHINGDGLTPADSDMAMFGTRTNVSEQKDKGSIVRLPCIFDPKVNRTSRRHSSNDNNNSTGDKRIFVNVSGSKFDSS